MAGRLSRFLNLEGARPAAADAPNAAAKHRATSGRFDPARAPAVALDPSPADRPSSEEFDQLQAMRRAQLQSGLSLDEHSDEEQPFVRCGQCETDSARGTVRCKTCGADLETPAQQAFNQALWKARTSEMAHEREEQAARAQKESEEHHASLADQQRALGEALAGEVRERESVRLGWMDERSGTAPSGAPAATAGSRSVGMRLLDKIPHPGARFATALALLGLASFLGWRTMFPSRGERNPLLQLGFFVLLFLFIPTGRRRGLLSPRNRW